MPRPSKTVLQDRAIAQEKRDRYLRQEAKRADKIQIDQKIVQRVWMIAVGIAFIASAVISFNGITSVSEFVGLTFDWQQSMFFFFIEFMYLIFLVAYLLLASRIVELASGEFQQEATKGSLIGMSFFAGVAILANAFHTFDYHDWDFTSPYTWAGVVLSVSAPVAILSVSKLASRVVFAKAVKP